MAFFKRFSHSSLDDTTFVNIGFHKTRNVKEEREGDPGVMDRFKGRTLLHMESSPYRF